MKLTFFKGSDPFAGNLFDYLHSSAHEAHMLFTLRPFLSAIHCFFVVEPTFSSYLSPNLYS